MKVKDSFPFYLFLVLLFASRLVLSQIPPTPTISVMNSTVGCPPDNPVGGVYLISSASYGNLWSNGDTTQYTRIKTTGGYSVTQTIAGITSSPSAVIQVSIHPFSVFLPPIGPLCASDAPIALQGSPPGGFYTGNALSGTNFVPSLANIGDFNIVMYQYSQTFGTDVCIDTSYIRIVVSECVGLNELLLQTSPIRICPNLESSSITIESKEDLILGAKLKDMNGKTLQVIESVFQHTINLPVVDLPTGVYLLELCFENKMHRQRILW